MHRKQLEFVVLLRSRYVTWNLDRAWMVTCGIISEMMESYAFVATCISLKKITYFMTECTEITEMKLLSFISRTISVKFITFHKVYISFYIYILLKSYCVSSIVRPSDTHTQ